MDLAVDGRVQGAVTQAETLARRVTAGCVAACCAQKNPGARPGRGSVDDASLTGAPPRANIAEDLTAAGTLLNTSAFVTMALLWAM